MNEPGLIHSVTDATSNITQYGYDNESNLTSITDANNHTTNFTYDQLGRVTQTTFPSTLYETYGYDGVGNLTSKTDRKNQTIQYVAAPSGLDCGDGCTSADARAYVEYLAIWPAGSGNL